MVGCSASVSVPTCSDGSLAALAASTPPSAGELVLCKKEDSHHDVFRHSLFFVVVVNVIPGLKGSKEKFRPPLNFCL